MLHTPTTEKNDKFANKRRDATGFISVGLVLVLFSVLFHSGKPGDLIPILLEFLSHVGIGLLVIGILAILIDFDHWTQYFEKRLSNIVVEKKYLKNLDEKALIGLQTDVLKAYFDNDNIGGTDGFLNHYQRNIQSLVNSPFRTNVNLCYQIDYIQTDPGILEINETMTWTCKSNAGQIQKAVSWVPDDYEVEAVKKMEASIQHDSFITKENETGWIKYDFEALKEKGYLVKDQMGFELPLSSYLGLENLRVKIFVKYIVLRGKSISWRMAYPTRGMNLSVQFPKDLIITTEPFYNEFITNTTSTTGYFHLNSEDWMMPGEGISMQLFKAPEAAQTPGQKPAGLAAELHDPAALNGQP